MFAMDLLKSKIGREAQPQVIIQLKIFFKDLWKTKINLP